MALERHSFSKQLYTAKMLLFAYRKVNTVEAIVLIQQPHHYGHLTWIKAHLVLTYFKNPLKYSQIFVAC